MSEKKPFVVMTTQIGLTENTDRQDVCQWACFWKPWPHEWVPLKGDQIYCRQPLYMSMFVKTKIFHLDGSIELWLTWPEANSRQDWDEACKSMEHQGWTRGNYITVVYKRLKGNENERPETVQT